MNKKLSVIFIFLCALALLTREVSAEDSAFKKLEVSILKDDYSQAAHEARRIISKYRHKDTVSRAYYLLGVSLWKQGKFAAARKNLEYLSRHYPDSKFSQQAKNLLADAYFSVQVGSFSKKDNAQKLTKKLIKQGYQAYMPKLSSDNLHRVWVGKFSEKSDALRLERSLKNHGYPTKLRP